jgi:CRISPR/Cas system CMR subunit Cmr4 (Cas7 group RAMP superfamily)
MTPDRIHLVYHLTFETPFHCGTGIREGLIDRTIVRDGQGYLYIPGSTFKGVLRERCEQLARFFDQPDVASPHDERAALLRLRERQPGMVTRIFGSQNHPGRLFFDDAHQSEDDRAQYGSREGKGNYQSLQVSLSTQVRLDRPTRTAVDKALYTSEFGTNDLAFSGVIQGWLDCRPIPTAPTQGPAPTYSLLLLLAGLRLVDRLGGNKSTGKGRCVCTIDAFTLNRTPITRHQWEGWLEHLDDLATYREEAQP